MPLIASKSQQPEYYPSQRCLALSNLQHQVGARSGDKDFIRDTAGEILNQGGRSFFFFVFSTINLYFLTLIFWRSILLQAHKPTSSPL